MGNDVLDPEMALQLFHVLLYCMAYIFGGAALIGLSVYIVLVGSEMLFSQPRSKTQRAKVPQSARLAPVAEETLVNSLTQTSICGAPEVREKQSVWVNTPRHEAQAPRILVPVTLESEPTGPEAA